MAEFGNNTAETDGGEEITTARLCNSAAFPANGTITGVSVYLGFAGAGSMRGAVYSSAGDDPASAALVLDLGTLAMTGTAWNTWSGLSITATSGVRYWIAVKSSVSAFWRYRNSLPANDWALNNRPISGETASEADAWDGPIASQGASTARGHGAYFTYTAAVASAAVTGTAGDGCTETQVVAGGETIIITLTNDTWVASGATFDAIRDDIIAGLDSAQSEGGGWNAKVRDVIAVTSVTRTSDTIVTITLPAVADYAITANETITVTVPAAAVTGAAPISATPTFDVTNVTPAAASSTSGVRSGANFITSALRTIVSRYAG